jgi:hypothetical protein
MIAGPAAEVLDAFLCEEATTQVGGFKGCPNFAFSARRTKKASHTSKSCAVGPYVH